MFFRYALVRGFATALHYAVLILLVKAFDVPAAPSAALCGATLAYGANRRITFAATAVGHQQAIAKFMLVAACAAALSGAVVWVGVHLLGWHYLLAQASAILLALGLSHRFNRAWTFAP
jgi:putative flippase GtrA